MPTPPDTRLLPPIPGPGARPDVPDPAAVEQTVGWLRAEHAAGRARSNSRPVPLLGSAQWCALGDDDAAKWCAILVAALAWYRDGLDLPRRLWRELTATHEAIADALAEAEAAENEDFARLAAWVRRRANDPTWAELEQRRANYTTPALTPEQMLANARASWASFEARMQIGAAA